MEKKPSINQERFRMEGDVAVINDPSREKIRVLVSNIYGIQKLRIQCGNRMVASYLDLADKSRERVRKAKEAQNIEDEGTTESVDGVSAEEAISDEIGGDTDDEKAKKDKENNKKIKLIMTEYRNITDYIQFKIKTGGKAGDVETRAIRSKDIEKAISELRRQESGDREAGKGSPKVQFIGEVYDYIMADQYQKLLDLEKSATKALEDEVKKHPLWGQFFADVRGCGPVMAAVCISYFDPYRARHASAFWKYAGLDVVVKEDGTTEGRAKWHIEKQIYYDKNGKPQEKMGITYNPKLRSKLLGVLGGSFIKLARDPDTKAPIQYAKTYYDYKHRIKNRAGSEDLTDIHIHKMAIRYCVKQFVRDMWVAWRELEGLEVTVPYEVAYLGHNPHGYNSGLPTSKTTEG